MNWLQKTANTIIKTAMFVHGEGEFVIAYKSRVFLIDPHEQDLNNPIIRQMANFLGTETRDLVAAYGDTWDYVSSLRDLRPDILQGTLSEDRDSLTLQSNNFQHGTGSRLLQNVIRALNVENVYYENESGIYDNFNDWQIEGNLPEYMFHGTTSEYADRILRFGLQPGESTTNYPGRGIQSDISHDEIVFLTKDIDRASYHAINAVSEQKGFPIVFRFKIPDPNLLVSDYDVEIMYDDDFEGNIYTNTYKSPKTDYSPRIKEEPFGFSKKVGVFGYRGRIPASFIADIMIRPEEGEYYQYEGDQWISVTADQLEAALEFDDPTMFEYKPEEEQDWQSGEVYSYSNWFTKVASVELMYHGTNRTFDSFDVSFAGARDWGDYGVGIYLSNRVGLAITYAHEAVKNNGGGDPVVYVVKANLSNVASFDELMEGIRSVGAPEDKDTTIQESGKQSRPEADSRNITAYMVSRGFDAARVGMQVVVYDPSLLSITRVLPAAEAGWLP